MGTGDGVGNGLTEIAGRKNAHDVRPIPRERLYYCGVHGFNIFHNKESMRTATTAFRKDFQLLKKPSH